MKKLNGKGFSAVEALLILVIIGVIGGVSYYVYNAQKKTNTALDNATQSQTDPEKTGAKKEKPKVTCGSGEDEKATNGTFCSQNLGIKFKVPKEFTGLLTVAENYDIHSFDLQKKADIVVGKSEAVFKSSPVVAQDTEGYRKTYHMSIAQTPLVSRPGPTFIPSYFDSTKKALYDDETELGATTRKLGKELKFIEAADVKFYIGEIGDGGLSRVTYIGVIGDKVIEIKLESEFQGEAQAGDKVIDSKKIFEEFENNIKQLKTA